nr:hypothetical protein [Lactiplantibacillus plantarum]
MESTNNIFLNSDSNSCEDSASSNKGKKLLTAIFGAFVVASSINNGPINLSAVNPDVTSSNIKIEDREARDTVNYQLNGGISMSENNGFLTDRDYTSLNKLIDTQNKRLDEQIALTQNLIDTQNKYQKESLDRVEASLKELNDKIDGLPSQEETIQKIEDTIKSDKRQWITWGLAILAILSPIFMHFL